MQDHIVVTCKNDFELKNRMNISLPGAVINLPILSEEDEQNIPEFALKHNTDFICASFTRKASDIEYIRTVLANHDSNCRIIAKIENHEGLHNFDEILAEADGIIFSRNSISMEMPPEKVLIAQKWAIEKCNLAAKPIFIHQQLLESMIHKPKPTRHEASDISNCVLEGTDGFVLDQETGEGNFPVQAVEQIVKCSLEAEKMIDWRKNFNDIKMYSPAPYGTAESVACASVQAVLDLKVDIIVVMSETGKLARLVAKYKPQVPVICCSQNDFVIQSMAIQRGITGVLASDNMDLDEAILHAIAEAKKHKLCIGGAKVVSITGTNEDTPEETNIMKIMNVE